MKIIDFPIVSYIGISYGISYVAGPGESGWVLDAGGRPRGAGRAARPRGRVGGVLGTVRGAERSAQTAQTARNPLTRQFWRRHY